MLSAHALFADIYTDTITLSTDSAGPFFLPPFFFKENSVVVTADFPIPPWRFYSSETSVRFQSAVKKGTTLYISAERDFGSLKQTYYNLKPHLYDSSKSVTTFLPAFANEPSSHQNVDVSGEKAVGIHLGQGGEFSMDQSLDVKLYGKISDSSVLSANISDQSTSLEGDTKEIGEIDRIFLTLEHPRRQLTAGDLLISTDSTGLLKERESPKGIAGALKTSIGKISGFGAVSGNRFAIEYLSGISGIQSGSYTLKGNGEPGQIIPIDGSVELTVQGKKLREGPNEDFIIDYTAGAIRFTSRFTILDGDLIEIRYRYREQNYSTFNSGFQWNFDRDSTVRISTAILLTKDNLNESATTLSKEDRDSLTNGGDSAPLILSGKKIHPNDVPKESARNRIYRLTADSSAYSWESQPIEHALIRDLYLVTFTLADSGTYLPYSELYRPVLRLYHSQAFLDSIAKASHDSLYLHQIYCEVPKGVGTHTAFHTAPLPEQLIQGEILSTYTPSDQLSIHSVIAGKARDKNRLSSKDDEDNNSGGFLGTIKLSTPPENRFVLSTKADFSYAGIEFTSSGLSRFDLDQKWGIAPDSVQFATAEGSVSFREHSWGSITFGGGHAQQTRNPYSSIATSAIELLPSKPISPSYSILIRSSETYAGQPGRRQQTRLRFHYPAIESELSIEEEWLERSEELSRGYLKETAHFSFPKIGLTQYVEQKNSSSGNGSHSSAEDFNAHSLWKQSLTRTIRDNHALTITTSLLNQSGSERDGITVLVSALKKSRYRDNRTATECLYTINSESATSRRWQYIFVGEGIGTHIRDSISGEFLPAPFGDYLAEEIVLWGDGTKRMVQNGLNYHWSWTNRSRSLLSDGFSLEGTVSSQEDIVLSAEIGSALIPMVSTFSRITHDTVSYSQLSYSQRIGWIPPSLSGFSTGISGQVYRKEDFENLTRRFEGSGFVRKEWQQFNLENKLRGIIENRNNLNIRDGSYEPMQEFPIRKILIPFIEEIFGRTSLDDSIGYYIAARPGIRFIPKDLGNMELSYAIAQLNYNGTLIYPMAKEFLPGINHRIYFTLNLNTKKYLSFTGFFRGDYSELKDWKFMTSLRASVKF